MKKSLVILFAAALGLAACNTEKKGPGGLLYKVHKSGGKDKIKEGDVVKLNITQKTEKDSLLGSTYDFEQAQVMPVGKKQFPGDLMDALTLVGEGDSVTFKINLDSMAFYSKQPKPDLFKNDKFVSLIVKVEKVFKKGPKEADSTFQKRASDFFQADYKADMDKKKTAEPAKIKAYIEDNNLKVQTSPSGLQYIITAPGSGAKPVDGDTVSVNYIGRFTKKGEDKKYKIFDTNVESAAKEAKMNQPGRPYTPVKMPVGSTVPGFTEALKLVGKGGKITAIIPSKLGYGEQGGGPIAPYSPLVFEIEVLDVIKPKAGAVAPATPVAPTAGHSANDGHNH
ncbi:FKBP-type peptidyl-prolyl cis-trans isomerase [Nubsella zeaxanthinifaciens]|jgi:FKBP-type peptidyl-prolyl cis-trans isomerase FkpA|uniref:FKBP-type peptidyl-prolyl cis-trans isomerase n=1 Tax=Nubsella zeaxanthinifaciens TaxID=392412 RepID=UPI000DE1F5F4|nr:FKBP-type peptidyl-prolyl cis-trans isomerase [Nubsella zeaxanthinifaciens]